jgi:hypothetical protein
VPCLSDTEELVRFFLHPQSGRDPQLLRGCSPDVLLITVARPSRGDLEILVGAGSFDPEKHCDCLALQSATTNHVFKQYKSQK